MQLLSGMIIAQTIDQIETFCRRCSMNILSTSTLVSAILLMLTLPVFAGATPTQLAKVNQPDHLKKVSLDQELAQKHVDFERFAKSKVKQLNANNRFSRSRMEIVKQTDGKYRGRYHQIDDSTLSVKVRRSQSSSIPYVAVLSYREQVFESKASTREQLSKSQFAVVEVIPNRHIFSYQKGAWD